MSQLCLDSQLHLHSFLAAELMTTEEKAAQKLSDREEELNANLQKLQKIEERLLQASEEDTKMKTSTKYPFTRNLEKYIETRLNVLLASKSWGEFSPKCSVV